MEDQFRVTPTPASTAKSNDVSLLNAQLFG